MKSLFNSLARGAKSMWQTYPKAVMAWGGVTALFAAASLAAAFTGANAFAVAQIAANAVGSAAAFGGVAVMRGNDKRFFPNG